MKKSIIITLAVTLCALTSCGKDNVSFPEAATSPADKPNAVAISAEITTELTSAKPSETTVTSVTNDTKIVSAETNNKEAQVTDTNTAQLENETAENNAFSAGISNGNVYTSEFAGIKITIPENVHFLNSDDLNTHYIMPTRFMSEAEKETYFTGTLDASACYGEDMENAKYVDVWFFNTKLRYPDAPDITAAEFMQRNELSFSPDIEATDISAPETVELCGKSYIKASYTVFDQNHINYVRRINDDYIMSIRVSGFTPEDFESRLEAAN